MYLGHLVEIADRDELYARPAHPYTKALLDAAPIPDPLVERARAPRALRGRDSLAIESTNGLRISYAMPDCRRDLSSREPDNATNWLSTRRRLP